MKGYTAAGVRLVKNFSQVQNCYGEEDSSPAASEHTEKWNPVTFALYNGNWALLQYLVANVQCANTSKLLRFPGMFKTQMVNQLYPFMASMNNLPMFTYFWEELGYLWTEDTFENVFKMLAKRGLDEYAVVMFRSRTAHGMFGAMSYSYRFLFLEHVLQVKHDVVEEVCQQNGLVGNCEEETVKKKEETERFFRGVYEELCLQPYSMHFYMGFSKEIIREMEEGLQEESEFSLNILKKTYKCLKASDIDLFIYHKPEVAL